MSHSPCSPEPREADATVPGPVPEPPATGDYTAAGVPTFEHVRDRIEGRVASAVGGTELAEESTEGRTVAQQYADREAAARDRLEQIRRSLRGDDK